MTSLAFAATTMVLAWVERERARDRARENRKARFEPLREPL
jgi:hypothetical protein